MCVAGAHWELFWPKRFPLILLNDNSGIGHWTGSGVAVQMVVESPAFVCALVENAGPIIVANCRLGHRSIVSRCGGGIRYRRL